MPKWGLPLNERIKILTYIDLDKTKYVVRFVTSHSDLVLWVVTWSSRLHTLMEFQRSKSYEKGNMGHTSSAKYVILFCKSRSWLSNFVGSHMEC